MDVLWAKSPLAASQVADRLSAHNSWSLKTVKTLLSRLVDKGAANHETEGRRFLYYPVITRQRYAQSAAGRLVDQLFGGRAAPLVTHLAEGRGLTPEDVHELEKLIKDLKREHD